VHARETRASESGEQKEAENNYRRMDNIQRQAIQVNVEPTSNPLIFAQSLMHQAFLHCMSLQIHLYIFPFFVNTILVTASNIKINCLLKLPPPHVVCIQLVIEVVQDHDGQHHHWSVV